jgi:hypothetical protein
MGNESANIEKQAAAYKGKYPITLSSPDIVVVKYDVNKRALNNILSFYVLPGTLYTGLYPHNLSLAHMNILYLNTT